MLKAALFDIDNTLIWCDFFRERSAEAVAEAMVRYGLPDTAHNAAKRVLAAYERCTTDYEMVMTPLVLSYGITDPMEIATISKAGEIAHLRTKLDTMIPFPGVEETLETLGRTLKLGIITDAPRERAIERLILAGLLERFELIVTISDTDEEKPSEKPFRLALARLGLRADEVLYVGDKPDSDIAGAKKVGMQTCLFRSRQCKGSEARADFEIDGFEGVVSVVERINRMEHPPKPVFRQSIASTFAKLPQTKRRT